MVRALGVVLGVVAALTGGPLAAQQPEPKKPAPDTVAADTTGAAADTLVQRAAEPPAPYPHLPVSPDTGLDAGRWAWGRADLMRIPATTLTEVVNRVPGVTDFRFGYYGAPEAVSVLGSGSGALEVTLDGYALDPLGGPSVDLSALPLAGMDQVRLERSPAGARLELRSAESSSAQPYSYVEAQAGEPLGLTVFRGEFLAPHFVEGPVALGVERTASDGLNAAEGASVFNGWLKWGISRPGHGVQLMYRKRNADRGGAMPFAGRYQRSDLVVRGATRLLSGSVLEVYGGRSTADDSVSGLVARSASDNQLGARLGMAAGPVWARAGVRWRSAEWLPRLQADAEASTALSALTLAGHLRWNGWRGGATASAVDARAEIGPLAGFSVFAAVADGGYGVPLPLDTLRSSPPVVDRHASRLGARFAWRGLEATGAVVRLRVDSVFSFGLPFDSAARPFPGGERRGYEVAGGTPLFTSLLRFEGSYVRWTGGGSWIYLPVEEGRGALVLHALPLASGNLEVQGSFQVTRRGAMLVPDTGSVPVTLPGRFLYSAGLQIRVVTVRAFLRWENIANSLQVLDFPGRILPGQRIVYGVKWELWN